MAKIGYTWLNQLKLAKLYQTQKKKAKNWLNLTKMSILSVSVGFGQLVHIDIEGLKLTGPKSKVQTYWVQIDRFQ